MEKLERYLDQVCRSIGGSRALRQHVRQELSEHLRDAAAQYQATGLSEDEALDRALGEFGKPEEVRSEMETAYGQRMMAVVIDKALQWKEMTMRAKWLWMSWAHLSLVAVIALSVGFFTFTLMLIAPKHQLLLQKGLIDPQIHEEPAVSWIPSYLDGLFGAAEFATLFVLLAIVVWGLFEWRVKSENKSFMRLSALGTLAVGLLALVIVTAGSIMVSFCYGVPAAGRLARPFALEQDAEINRAASALDAMKANDWAEARKQIDRAQAALENLAGAGPAIPSLTKRNEPPTIEELRSQVQQASDALEQAEQAARGENSKQFDAAIERFRKAYEPVREAAKRPAR